MAIIKYPGLLYTKVNMSYQYTQGAMVSIAWFTDINIYMGDTALGGTDPSPSKLHHVLRPVP